jgi:hypothetical protein
MLKRKRKDHTNIIPIIFIGVFLLLLFKVKTIPGVVTSITDIGAKIVQTWKNEPFLSLCALSVLFIIFVGCYQLITKSCKGSWSKYFVMPKSYKKIKDYSKYKDKKDSKGETECRRVLEEVFNVEFGKDRPDFLNNPVTGGNFNLELDCYNKNLKLAVEYNGVQHYKYTPFFHKNEEAFQNQKYRDELKRRMCKDNVVTLIEVPYTVKIDDIEKYLLKELLKNGYVVT